VKRAEQVLSCGELIPVLRRPDESTCANSEVGTCTKSTPRRRIAAANPARSRPPPPPSAIHQIVALDLRGDQRFGTRSRPA